MKLTYFQGNPPNFGDELNATMWHELLPKGFLDEDASQLFIGIGSVIQHDYPETARKIVVGSGYAGYTKMPDVHDGTWDIRFVRGPRTAQLLGLDPDRVIADAAVLLRATELPDPTPGIGVAFIPHYESLERGDWPAVCAMAGIHFIDPSKPHEQVIADLRGADLVIAEAMHGAIVADALRTPWIGVRTMHQVHRLKWHDWAEALDIYYAPAFLFPSNGREGWAAATGRSGSGPRARAVLNGRAAVPLNHAFRHAAARSLRKLSASRPNLSPDTAIENATARALEALDLLVRDYSEGEVRRSLAV